jgi:glucose/arabinose dehydrogenase
VSLKRNFLIQTWNLIKKAGSILFVILLISACSAASVETRQTLPPAKQESSAEAPELNKSNTEAVPSTVPPTPQATLVNTPATGQIQLESDLNKSITNLPEPGGFAWQQIITGLIRPVAFIAIPRQPDRFLVVEQPGLVRILDNGVMLTDPFLDIQDRVGSEGAEQGLLDLEPDPNFAENGYFYVNYTNREGDTRISRFQTVDPEKVRAEPNSEEIILQIQQPYSNHNGGDIDFGPDGLLYIATGDGGSAGDPLGNAQSLNTLLGKILRIDVNGELPYSIPDDNPFVSGDGLAEIWAYGLRNPWRFSFDSLTGDIYIADVGQDMWEEINYSEQSKAAGVNFGWNIFEGNHEYSGVQPSGFSTQSPVLEYNHGSGCSVTGGEVYRGNQLPELYGVYFYGDYCSGNVWGLFKNEAGSWQNKLLFENIAQISSFGLDDFGELYLVDHNGRILKLVGKSN